ILVNNRRSRINAVVSPAVSRSQIRVEGMVRRSEGEVVRLLRQKLLPALMVGTRSLTRSGVGAFGGRWAQFMDLRYRRDRQRLNKRSGCRAVRGLGGTYGGLRRWGRRR